jgi:hypothetical protein
MKYSARHLLSIRVFAAFALVLALLLPGFLSSQSFRGSIRGKVTDPSGGLVAAAKVSSRNVNTGLTRDAATTDEGSFVIAELPSGTYTVTVRATGFAEVAQTVVVEVGRDTTADFDMLRLQKQHETVTVSEEAPLIEATRDVLGEVVDQRLVSNLPLNGRDFGKLVALVPGATVEPSGVAAIQSGFGQFSINGNRDRSNNYTVDGTDNNDPFFNNSAFNQVGIGGAPASLLPIDAIQEFNLQANFPPEYGRNSGSVVNILTKSGTNRIHGSAFEFLRNSGMDARNYFNRAIDPNTGLPVKKTAFRNNNFGASIGGPIVKDRTFFFGAYEGQRERVGSDFTFLVPTQEQIGGAQALIQSNGLTPNPALTNILGLFQSLPGYTGTSGSIAATDLDKNDLDTFILKIDHQLTSNNSLTGRYAFARDQQVFPLGGLGFGAGSRLQQFAQTSPTRVQLVSASFLSTLGPTKINEVRFGYSRYRTSFAGLDGNSDPASFGTSGFPFNLGSGKSGLPEIDFGGTFENLGASGFSIPRGRTSQSFQILDNFTLVHGRHTIKLGGEYRRAKIDSFNDNLERGIFAFFGEDPSAFALCPGQPTDPAACSDGGALMLASYYLGDTFPLANAGNTQRNTFNNGLSFFAQDDFRIAPNLTVNYGMRWEYFGPVGEAHNLLSNLGADGNLALVGTDGLTHVYNRDLNNFGPRVGFAWTALPTTVIRGAYGIYYDYIPQDLMIANFTNSAGLATNAIGPQPVVPLNYDQTGWDGTGAGNAILSLPSGPFPNPGSSIFVTPRNLVTPYSQNWNLNIEQQFSPALVVQVGYTGSKGTKLVRLRDANQPDVNGNLINFPQYGPVDQFTTVSFSNYNALQATLRTRNWHGLSGFTGYTWSKSLDDASDGIDFNFSTVAFPQDSNNLAADYGASNFDTKHRFTAAFSYALPEFSSHKRLGAGWALNTIMTAQSGRPAPIVSANDTSGFGGVAVSNFHQRPNMVPGVNPIVGDWKSSPDGVGYLNAAAFIQPAEGTFGTMQRNSIYGPRFWNLDFAVTKDTRLTERLTLQLRAEFFNIFNHPNFALPEFFINPAFQDVGTPGGPNIVQNPTAYDSSSGAPLPAGLITQTPDQAQTNPGLGGGGPRVIQLGVKFLF